MDARAYAITGQRRDGLLGKRTFHGQSLFGWIERFSVASSVNMDAATRLATVAAVALLSGCYLADSRETPGDVLAPPAGSSSRPPGAAETPGDPPPRTEGSDGEDGVREGPETTPPLVELLTCVTGLEAWSRECPDPVVVYVSTDGSDDAPGTVDAPIASPVVALQRCGTAACHIRLHAGCYDMRDAGIGGRCLRVEGGMTTAADGTWQRDPVARSELAGDGRNAMIGSDGALLVEGVTLTNTHAGIATNRARLLIVSDVEVAAAYAAVMASWSSERVRICNSTLNGGYVGIDVSWSSHDVVIDDVIVHGGYSGIDVNWESHDVLVRRSHVTGGYEAISISQGAYDVVVEDSEVTTTGDDAEG